MVTQTISKRTIIKQINKQSFSIGFLYHADSARFLLQKDHESGPSNWKLMGSKCLTKFSAQSFKNLVQKQLNLEIQTLSIHHIYDYYQRDLGRDNFVSYAEVESLKDFPEILNQTFAWFTLKEISKLSLSQQTKQDLIVGQRVIDSDNRRKTGERTIG